jgi:hypothetical protein
LQDPAASIFKAEVCSETWLFWEVEVVRLRRVASNRERIPSQWEEMDQRKRRLQGSHWFVIMTGSGTVRMYRRSRARLLLLGEK